MPGPEGSAGYMASFSFASADDDDDTPRCVVFATPTKFYIACAGDKTWTEHSYENDGMIAANEKEPEESYAL
ncbi:hypothetical protein FRX31_002827 [Thalictrum thalictroides]|uniref:Uncharacterized protein n=1 Tax=Thalictrum thalictroides TaxID=46969 RepID=A0A7J6XCW5_THATH|nr:hypothetical protein FRX31_002827 [Thalictrum thalictroides]